MTQIEIIEVILNYFEKGVKPAIKKDMPIAIFDKIDELTPKDYLAAYRSFLEWKQPLLQRTSTIDTGNKPKLNF